MKFENIGLSFNYLILGITLLLFGFVTYYLIPLSVVNGDTSMFMFIMYMIMFFMVVGMAYFV